MKKLKKLLSIYYLLLLPHKKILQASMPWGGGGVEEGDQKRKVNAKTNDVFTQNY